MTMRTPCRLTCSFVVVGRMCSWWPRPPFSSSPFSWCLRYSVLLSRSVSPFNVSMGDFVCTHTGTPPPRACVCVAIVSAGGGMCRHVAPLSHSLAGPLWCRADAFCSLLRPPRALVPLRDARPNSYHSKRPPDPNETRCRGHAFFSFLGGGVEAIRHNRAYACMSPAAHTVHLFHEQN